MKLLGGPVMGTGKGRAGCRNSVPTRRRPRALDIGEEGQPETWEPTVTPIPDRHPVPARQPQEAPEPDTVPV